jgi:putative aldouronate transport system substrate-binding protein
MKQKFFINNVGISKIPSTLTEFEDAVTKFRNNDPDKDGKKDTYGFSNSMMPIIYAAYGITDGGACGLTTQNGKIVFSSTTAEAKQVLTKLAAWYKDGIIDPQYITGEHTTGYWAISNAFENNTIGVTGLGSFYHYIAPMSDGDLGGAVYQDFKKVNPNMQFAPGKSIVGPTGKPGAIYNNYASEPIGITVNGAKNPRIVDATFAMLNAVYSDDKDYIIMNAQGVKDVDFTVNAQGVYTTKISAPADARKKGIGVFEPFCIKQTQSRDCFRLFSLNCFELRSLEK